MLEEINYPRHGVLDNTTECCNTAEPDTTSHHSESFTQVVCDMFGALHTFLKNHDPLSNFPLPSANAQIAMRMPLYIPPMFTPPANNAFSFGNAQSTSARGTSSTNAIAQNNPAQMNGLSPYPSLNPYNNPTALGGAAPSYSSPG